jgi:hypothetical protein
VLGQLGINSALLNSSLQDSTHLSASQQTTGEHQNFFAVPQVHQRAPSVKNWFNGSQPSHSVSKKLWDRLEKNMGQLAENMGFMGLRERQMCFVSDRHIACSTT